MRPRLAVLLTRSISTRLPQLLAYKQIAPQSPHITLFVSKRLRTLSFSVSCKSCVCHSCENGRVCTNNSRFGSHLALIPEKIGPFFSCTYVEPILQPFCFQIHACNGGVYPPLALPLSSAIPSSLNPIPYPLSFQVLAHSFALFCTHQKLNPFFFKHFRTLYAKQGGGVLWLTGHPMEDVCPERPSGGEGPLLRLIRESVLPAPTLSGSIAGRSIATGGFLFQGPRNTDHDSPWLLEEKSPRRDAPPRDAP